MYYTLYRIYICTYHAHLSLVSSCKVDEPVFFNYSNNSIPSTWKKNQSKYWQLLASPRSSTHLVTTTTSRAYCALSANSRVQKYIPRWQNSNRPRSRLHIHTTRDILRNVLLLSRRFMAKHVPPPGPPAPHRSAQRSAHPPIRAATRTSRVNINRYMKTIAIRANITQIQRHES